MKHQRNPWRHALAFGPILLATCQAACPRPVERPVPPPVGTPVASEAASSTTVAELDGGLVDAPSGAPAVQQPEAGAEADATVDGDSGADSAPAAAASSSPNAPVRTCGRGGKLVVDTWRVCLTDVDLTADKPLAFTIIPGGGGSCEERAAFSDCDITVQPDGIINIGIRVCRVRKARPLGCDSPFINTPGSRGCVMDKPLPPGTYTLVSSGRAYTLRIPSTVGPGLESCF